MSFIKRNKFRINDAEAILNAAGAEIMDQYIQEGKILSHGDEVDASDSTVINTWVEFVDETTCVAYCAEIRSTYTDGVNNTHFEMIE